MLRRLQVQKEAIQAVEQDGMVFIDEIDKIVTSTDSRYGMLCSCSPTAVFVLIMLSLVILQFCCIFECRV